MFHRHKKQTKETTYLKNSSITVWIQLILARVTIQSILCIITKPFYGTGMIIHRNPYFGGNMGGGQRSNG